MKMSLQVKFQANYSSHSDYSCEYIHVHCLESCIEDEDFVNHLEQHLDLGQSLVSVLQQGRVCAGWHVLHGCDGWRFPAKS